ncbi:MAG: gliding motility-associated C-terminal domain-containing protein [Bacteroidia bacterium]|nr:gliding motility-associated C-terminal domain-containing protein [Bacteroidia bacterium]
MKHVCSLLLFFAFSLCIYAQPVNDSFARAEELIIPQNGYGTGQFISNKVPLANITKELGEAFSPMLVSAGMDRKSAWFKFTVSNTRSVTIDLLQKDTMVPQNAAGLAIYERVVGTPNIGNLSAKLTPINKFGSTSNLCLSQGEYYIQLCARHYATDTAWIKITVNMPGSPDYDQVSTAMDMGSISGNRTTSLQVGCLSITDEKEFLPLIGSDYKDYSKTAWLMVKTDNYTEAFSMSMRAAGLAYYGKDSTFWGYRIYFGNMINNPTGLTCIDSGAVYIRNGNYFNKQIDSVCKLLPYTYYTIQLIFHKNDDYTLYMDLMESGSAKAIAHNPANIPSSHKLGTLPSNQLITSTDYFSCAAMVKFNTCGIVSNGFVQDSIFYNTWDPDSKKVVKKFNRIDTLDLAVWLTFTLPSDGLLDIYSQRWIQSIGTRWGVRRLKIYRGDVSENCNLSLELNIDSDERDLCLKAGKYSIQITDMSMVEADEDLLVLGQIVTTTLYFTPLAAELPANHDTPESADNLGDISDELDNLSNGLNTKMYHISGNADSASVGGKRLFGRFTYVSLHIQRPVNIKVRCGIPFGHTNTEYFVLLKGLATTIADSTALIPSRYGMFGYTVANNQLYSNCNQLDTGWYTVVAHSILDSCQELPTGFVLVISKVIYTSTPNYNQPHKAQLVNNGQPLSWTFNTGTPTYPKTKGIYSTGIHYFNCIPDTPFFVKLKCPPAQSSNQLMQVNYHVFYIANNNSSLKIRTVDFEPDYYRYYIDQYALYKGNCRVDSTILKDTLNIVSSCQSALTYCDMSSGWYTLVVYKYGALVPQQANYFFAVDKQYTSAFDYAANSYDMGLIPQSNVEVKSAPDFISCRTGADTNNIGMSNRIIQPSGNPNFVHPDMMPKNVWYTFQVTGTGDIKIKGYLYKYLKDYCPYTIAVYKSDDKTGFPFSALRDSGLVDSTLKQGLKLIGSAGSNSSGSPPTYSFAKNGCETERYYVVIEPQKPFRDVFQVELGVSFKGLGYPIEGDYCSNAVILTATAPSTVSAKAIVNCHTVGESFGEDGTNMGCLGDKNQVKTTWFKYTYQSNNKVDLVFSVVNRSNSPSSLIKYRVLYGNCKSMTSGPCVANGTASFKLDCMSAGEYYIQVVTPQVTVGEIEIRVTATTTVYPVCKPFDLNKPFSYFTPYGGCVDGKMKFTNYSSQGENIVYRWHFGNGTYSSALTPQVEYTQRYTVDTFSVKLVVTDTVLQKADSITIPVYVYYNSVWLEAGRDTVVSCAQELIQLKATTNYAFSQFEWFPANKFKNPYEQQPKVVFPENLVFTVKMITENCSLTDSLKMSVIADDKIEGNSVLNCYSSPIVLKGPAGYFNYQWSTGQFSPSITVTKTGKYAVRMTKGSCQVNDTIEVTGKNPLLFNLPKDTVICKTEQVKFSTSYKNVLWSTGSTDTSIVVNSSGSYWIRINHEDCEIYDTISVQKHDVNVSLPKPFILCENATVMLRPVTSGLPFSYKWSTGSTDSVLQVSQGGVYRVEVARDRCTAKDSTVVLLQTIPSSQLPSDTFYCDEQRLTLKVPSVFDAYHWSTGSTTQSIQPSTEGWYWIRVTKNNCSRIDSVKIAHYASDQFSLGSDTTFCGDFELYLDGGNALSYQWLPHGETSRVIYANEYRSFVLLRKDTQQCLTVDTIMISEFCDPTIFVPNAFTPNGNALNEVFMPVMTDVDEFQLLIYNRWGELVFESSSIDKGWDGTFNGKPAQQDAYVWMVFFKGKTSGSRKNISGSVTLLR